MGDNEIGRKSQRSKRALRLESLEARLALHADHLHVDPAIEIFPALGTVEGAAATPDTTLEAVVAGDNASLIVPAYSSLPGAPATLYLDFNGHFEASWGSYSNIDTPAYDQDGNPTTFSSGELASIQSIWQQVAEDYAPFNVNVTTVLPSSFANGVALRVAIGGSGSWYGSGGGVSYVNSFTSSISNVAFVFPGHLANGAAKYVGEAASHEAGHAFGLNHQSQYDGNGTKLSDYYSGPGDGRAPIMGNSYSATRGLWWNGTSVSASTYQDDMAVISRSTNGFGYRSDEAGNTAGTASPLQVNGTLISGSGVVTTTSDVDYWSFTTGAGTISLNVGVPSGINNLDAKAQLVDAIGNPVVGWQDPSNSFGTTINASLAAGSYRFVVGSHGGYGDVGQYTVSGTIIAPVNYLPAPTNLTATATSTSQVNLAWTDQANNETGYRVERSLNGSTWATLASLGANSTSFIDTGLAANTTYSYRVLAVNATTNSDYSNQASATTFGSSPAAPSNLTASGGRKFSILNWTDNSSNETGFKVQRSTDGANWATLTTLAPNTTAYATSSPRGSAYYYFRIVATNFAGDSSPSNVVTVASDKTGAGPRGASGSLGLEVSSWQAALDDFAALAAFVQSNTHRVAAKSTFEQKSSASLDSASMGRLGLDALGRFETLAATEVDTQASTSTPESTPRADVDTAFELLGTSAECESQHALLFDWQAIGA
jgi:hypothetical protein